jgi:tRNA G10  N-methylase Trm11
VAAGVKYIGTDVAPDTVEGNKSLAEWLGVTDAEVYLASAETFQPPPVQMVMTSPPYYRQERYEGGDQSWATYDSFESWCEGFLTPMVQRGVEALLPGGYWVLNIADVREGAVTYPLVEAAREVFRSSGLVEIETLQMPLSNLNRRVGGEPVLVWRKPSK